MSDRVLTAVLGPSHQRYAGAVADYLRQQDCGAVSLVFSHSTTKLVNGTPWEEDGFFDVILESSWEAPCR